MVRVSTTDLQVVPPQQIEKMRTPENFEKYYSQANDLLQSMGLTEMVHARSRLIRNRRRSTMLNGSVVGKTLGEQSEEAITLKSTFFETVDIILIEMD